jgi:putative hydrolase of the HAD superfamily
MDDTLVHQEELIDLVRKRAYPLIPQVTGLEERISRLPGIRAILFDIYGTLLISGSGDLGTARVVARRAAFQEALEPYIELDPGDCAAAAALAEETYFSAIEDYHARRRIAGIAYPEVEIRDVWRTVLGALADRGYVDRELKQKEIERVALDYELRVNPTWPMPEVVETVKTVSATLPVGVVSNAQFFTPLLFPALTHHSLQELGVEPELCAFSFLFGEAKPSPSLFNPVLGTLARQYGIAKDEVLYIGNDMLNDVWAATQHGMRVCLFAGDARSLRLREDDQIAQRVRPDAVVTSLSVIPRLVGIGETP